MTEQKTKKRAWVKNAAILFLTLMLVLTFFSNTIMNRSLPEVSAQYSESGTVTTKLRGSATVTPNKIYEVSIGESREILSVAVEAGDAVAVGDTLLYLKDAESEKLTAARDTLEALELQYQKALITATDPDYTRLYREIQSAKAALEAVKTERAQYTEVTAAALAAAEQALSDAEGSLTARRAEREALGADAEQSTVDAAEAAVTQAEAEVAAKQQALDALAQEKSAYEAADAAVKSAQATLDDLYLSLSQQQEADGKQQAIEALDLGELEEEIAEQKEKIAELEANAVGATVASAVSGVVSAVNVVAGNTAAAGQTLITVELVEEGYSVSIPVTAEQSKLAREGMTATVSANYPLTGVTATLSAVKSDPDSDSGGKLLVFDLTGDNFESGDLLNLSLTVSSGSFNVVVPNSAVREDADGTFVLVVASKSSPLGTRYYAKRTHVTVLAADDYNSAVLGLSEYGDYVIIASNAPVEAGQLVKLADS